MSCLKTILMSSSSNVFGLVLAIMFALFSAAFLGMSEERGTMSWFARPYFLLPLYVFPTLSILLALLFFTKSKLQFSSIQNQGKTYVSTFRMPLIL